MVDEGKIIIVSKKELEKIKKRMRIEGLEKFHVLSDFDRTLTSAFVNGERSSTVIAQIRNGNYLTEDYALRAHELFEKYHPVEIDPKVNSEKKNKKMREWWKKHLDLLIECGFDRETIREIVETQSLKFREGALDFLDFLFHQRVPLVIISASIGDMIEQYLKQEKKCYGNICVVANNFEFDISGKAIKIKEPIIHSLNKHEIVLKNFQFYNLIKERKNILLIGDSLDDINMVEGFQYDNLVKIGFLNEGVEGQLEEFKKKFDIIVLGDGDFSYINEFLEEVFG